MPISIMGSKRFLVTAAYNIKNVRRVSDRMTSRRWGALSYIAHLVSQVMFVGSTGCSVAL